MNRPFYVLREAADGGGAGGGGGGAADGAGGASGGQSGAAGGAAGGGQASGSDSPWFSQWIKPDGALNHAALDKAPDTFKESRKTLERYGKIDDVLHAFDNQRRIISLKGLLPLREGATEAEKAAHKADVRKFYAIPETPEGYGFKRPDNVPEDVWNQEFAQSMAKVMHENDIPPSAAKALFDAWNGYQGQAIQALEQTEQQQAAERLQEANAKLDQAFGVRRPAMEQLAVRGALAAGIDPNSDTFKNNPDVIIAMASVARLIGEDKLPRETGGAGGGMDAKAEYEAMHRDPSNRLFPAMQAMARGESHPLAAEAIRRRDFLAEQIATRQRSS